MGSSRIGDDDKQLVVRLVVSYLRERRERKRVVYLAEKYRVTAASVTVMSAHDIATAYTSCRIDEQCSLDMDRPYDQ